MLVLPNIVGSCRMNIKQNNLGFITEDQLAFVQRLYQCRKQHIYMSLLEHNRRTDF